MNILHSLADLPPELQGQVLLIGNFDGIHCGHQRLIEKAKNTAAITSKEVILLTFEPHPRALFRPDDPPFRLTPFPIKMRRLREEGVNGVVSLTFDWSFASQSADDFVQNILIKNLGASHIVVGDDFCFGQLRKGTPETIRHAGIPVTAVSPQNDPGGRKYSSSMIRQALREGRVQDANFMLGWHWEIEGEVVRGDQRGREMGYPTANIPLGETLHPSYGIYAAYVKLKEEFDWHPAAVNIGIRPMFELKVGQIEAFILGGFDRDIYGSNLRIRPVRKLRGEAKFNNLEDLKIQMKQDCLQAEEILNAAHSTFE